MSVVQCTANNSTKCTANSNVTAVFSSMRYDRRSHLSVYQHSLLEPVTLVLLHDYM